MNKHTRSVSLIDGHTEDAKVIKALEICGNIINADCKECSYEGKNCVVRLIQSTNDLINRQQAEIERLQGENERVKSDWASQKTLLEKMYQGHSVFVEHAKSETIKEFAKRLKKVMVATHKDINGYCRYETEDYYIDNLVKEMTETQETQK